jgi:APA family basic amino acid/polyamine antiporter
MFLSVLGYVNVTLMSNPRVMFAMSEEGILPPAFKRRTKRHDAIVYSLTTFCLAIILTLVFSSAVEKIINYTIFLDSIGMSSSAATLFIMRKRRIGEDREGIFRMKLYPWLPIIFIVSYIAIAISIVIDDPGAAVYGGVIFACFFGLYFLSRLRKPREGVV